VSAKYKKVVDPSRRRRSNGSLVFKDAHRVVVEQVLGRPLPYDAEVHHIDNNGLNNCHDNLVVCQDCAYHQLLHRRTRALKACGNPNWRKCSYCKQYDDPANMSSFTTCYSLRHPACINAFARARNAMNPKPRPRKMECKRGHLFTADSVWISKDGQRECRACMRFRNRVHKARLRAEKLAIRRAG
jgi:hypothetical protein